jgi:GNAT superfamily N-acetyltransferase
VSSKEQSVHVLTPAVRDTFQLRTATAAEADTLVELISLIDLHRPTDELPSALEPMRYALRFTDDGPLSHCGNHFLFADADGHTVGAIACGPAKWMQDVPMFMRAKVVRRITTIHGLAVREEVRRTGVARALVKQVEDTHRDAGYSVLTLRHERNLSAFYAHLGFTSASRIALQLPLGDRFALADRGWKYGIKLLSPSASITSVHGVPTITGALAD